MSGHFHSALVVPILISIALPVFPRQGHNRDARLDRVPSGISRITDKHARYSLSVDVFFLKLDNKNTGRYVDCVANVFIFIVRVLLTFL